MPRLSWGPRLPVGQRASWTDGHSDRLGQRCWTARRALMAVLEEIAPASRLWPEGDRSLAGANLGAARAARGSGPSASEPVLREALRTTRRARRTGVREEGVRRGGSSWQLALAPRRWPAPGPTSRQSGGRSGRRYCERLCPLAEQKVVPMAWHCQLPSVAPHSGSELLPDSVIAGK